MQLFGDGMRYVYGMRLRGFAPLCQPMEGLIEAEYDESGEYYSLLTYDRKLTEKEIHDYELAEVGEYEN